MRRLILKLVLVSGLLCLLSACENEAPGRNLESYIESARSYIKQGQFRPALIEIQNVLQRDPSNEAAIILSAKISMELGQIRSAYRQLERLDGKSFDYFRTLADAYIKARKYSSALLTIRGHDAVFSAHPVEKNVLSGRAFAGLGEYQRAESLFREVLDAEPANLEARMGLAAISALRGDLEAAEEALKEILEDAPQYIPALEWMSAVYLRQGRMDLAEDTLTSMISALPATDIYTHQRAGVLRTLIALLAQQGRSGEALVYQRILSEAFPGAMETEARYREALADIQAGELDKAEHLLLELYKESPGHETGGKLLGLLNFIQGRQEQAYNYFSESVDPETASPRLLEAIAANLLQMNRPDQVIEKLSERVEGSRDSQLMALYGVALLNDRQEEAGLSWLKKAIDIRPGNARLRLLLASHYNSRTPPQLKQALEVIEEGLEINSSAEIRIAYLDQLKLMGREDEAETFLREQLAENPEDFTNNLIAGTYWLTAGDLEKSAMYYSKAEKIQPDNKQVLFGLAETRKRSHDWKLAVAAYEKILAIDPADENAVRGVLQVYLTAGDEDGGVKALRNLKGVSDELVSVVLTEFYARNRSIEKAVEQLQRLERKDPDSFQTRRLSAEVAYRRALRAESEHNYTEAREAIFKALTSFPLNRRLLQTLARIEIRDGQLKEARKVLADIEQQYPGDAMVFEIAGDIALAEQDFSTARENYRKAWELLPSDALGAKLVVALSGLGRIEEADALTVEWKEKLPESVMAVVTRAELYPDDVKRAISLYEAQNRQYPGTPAVLNNLAWYHLRDGNLEKSAELARQAHELVPDNPQIMDTYGWILYQSGKGTEALGLLKRAARLAPNEAQIADHLKTVQAEVR